MTGMTHQLEVGDRFQDFEIVEVLARTLLSEVLLVRLGRAGGLAAIKLPGSRWRDEPRIAARFRSEQLLGQQLRHENLVRILPSPVSGTTFVVMEYVPGRTLRDELRESGHLGARRAIGLVRQLCSALTYLHERRIVHGAVRPEHIWMTTDDRVKLLDLGGVCVQAGGEWDPRSGHAVGGYAYCAPEQLRGRQPDASSDVYGTGAVLHEILTGTSPYAGESESTLTRVKQDQELLPPGSLRPLDAAVERIVLRATARDPRQRYRSVSELDGDLTDPSAAMRRTGPPGFGSSPGHRPEGNRRTFLRLAGPPRVDG